MRTWSDLPLELLVSIAKYTTIKDKILLRAVCTHWDAVLKVSITMPVHSSNQVLPWLLVPKQDPCCGFYSLSENKLYQIDMPEAYAFRCCGSSEGWLVMCSTTPSLFMLNPFTRSRIELPPITAFPNFVRFFESNIGTQLRYTGDDDEDEAMCLKFMEKHWIRKVILGGNPYVDNDCMAVAIYGGIYGHLGVCKLGDNMWTDVHQFGYLHDIIYWKGYYYGVNNGILTQFDLNGGGIPVVKELLHSRIPAVWNNYNYLVVCSGELLLVVKMYRFYTEDEFKDLAHCGGHCLSDDITFNGDLNILDTAPQEVDAPNFCECDMDEEDDDFDLEEFEFEDDFVDYKDETSFMGTTCFRLFKPDIENQTWTRIRNIGDEVLFIGCNSAMSFHARDFPECKPNHIYFTNDQNTLRGWAWEHDLGAMDLATRKVHRFPGCSRVASLFRPAPVWITASL